MLRICHPLQTLETKEVLVNSKTNSASSFFRLYLPLSIFILILFVGGCRQNEENASTSPKPAFVVPINDNNNDGFPDGLAHQGSLDLREVYEVSIDSTIGHGDETSILMQTNQEIEEGGFVFIGDELPNINRYKGTRLQFSGFIKTENVSDKAGIMLRIDGVGRGNELAVDDMSDRAPTGSTDWQQFTIVLDVPKDVAVSHIYYGLYLGGSGKVWLDDLQFDIVGEDIPVTDRLPEFMITREAAAAEETAVTQKAIFDELWQTVNDTYVSVNFNGVDWAAIKESYQAQIIQDSAPDEDFYALMTAMVTELNDDHSVFLNPEEAAEEDLLFSGDSAFDGVGMFIYTIPEAHGLVVSFTFPDGGAAEAGIQSHDIILAADGQPTCCHENGTPFPYEVRGPAGTTVLLTVQTPGEEPREVEVVRGPVAGNAPVTSDVIDGRIGTIFIPTMQDQTIAEQVETSWQTLNADGSLTGLVLDLRINSGGQQQVLQSLLELFTNGTVGEFSSRTETKPFTIQGRDVANSQNIPLVILIGPQSNSYAELFSGILQANGRAIVVGQTSRGNVETTHRHDFTDGSRAHIADETFIPADAPDANWEETGIIPDSEVIQAWYEFATPEEDLALIAAIDQFK